MNCKICSRPLRRNTPSGLCSGCRRECTICHVAIPKGGRCMCAECTLLVSHIASVHSSGYRNPDPHAEMWVDLYSSRAAKGLPLFGAA